MEFDQKFTTRLVGKGHFRLAFRVKNPVFTSCCSLQWTSELTVLTGGPRQYNN